jgi:spermidine/putrescine-binding protein
MLHSDARHPVCAYKWMNWSLTPKVQGDVAAWFGSLPVVPQGCKASALLGDKGCETNGYNEFSKIAFWKTPVAEGVNTCLTAAGHRTISRLWAAGNRPEAEHDVRGRVSQRFTFLW